MSIFLVFTLGLPLTVFSWYLHDHLFRSGELERSLDRREINQQVKNIRAQHKKDKTQHEHFLANRWMRFGGGFYGLTALYTFGIIELTDMIQFLWTFPGFAELFKDGFLALLLSALGNQIQNFVSAMIWFSYWGDGDVVITCVIIAYLGYYTGMFSARHELLPIDRDHDQNHDASG